MKSLAYPLHCKNKSRLGTYRYQLHANNGTKTIQSYRTTVF
jgi:hypothetical protein